MDTEIRFFFRSGAWGQTVPSICSSTDDVHLLNQRFGNNMDPETKAKLDGVLGRKAELESAARAEQIAREDAAQKKEAEREAARKRWNKAKGEIDKAIAVINAHISTANLNLSADEKPRSSDHPGLAQLTIALTEQGQPNERRLVLNVSALGLVQPVTLIPHSGPKIADFNISGANQATYESVIAEFLDICLTSHKSK